MCVFASLLGCFVWFVMTKRGKGATEIAEEVVYSSELGRSEAMNRFLAILVVEGWLSGMEVVWSPGSEITPTPHGDEVVVFSAFFDAGLRIPSAPLVAEVLGIYRVVLAQLTPKSIARLSISE